MIKKAKGIFLQYYSGNKEFNWNLHNSIFPQGDRSFKNAYKNYLSLGFSYPYDASAKEENKLSNLFFNNPIFKRLYRTEKKEKIHIDLNGYTDIIELLNSFDTVVSCISQHKKRIYGKAADTIISPKLLFNMVLGKQKQDEFSRYAQFSKKVLLIESFPYWADKEDLINLIDYGKKQINETYESITKKLYYENMQLVSTLYPEKIINSSCIQDYFLLAYAWSEILLSLKKIGIFIILDGSFTEFLVLPKLLYYQFNTCSYNDANSKFKSNANSSFYSDTIQNKTTNKDTEIKQDIDKNGIIESRSIEKRENVNNISNVNEIRSEEKCGSQTDNLWDLYMFGDNLSCGLSINLVLGNSNVLDMFAIQDEYNYNNPSKIKSIKFSFLSLLQKDIYCSSYSNLLFSIPKGNCNCLGPYVFIGKNYREISSYDYGLIPLNVEMDHFNAIKKAFKNKKI